MQPTAVEANQSTNQNTTCYSAYKLYKSNLIFNYNSHDKSRTVTNLRRSVSVDHRSSGSLDSMGLTASAPIFRIGTHNPTASGSNPSLTNQ